ncbi:TIR domain-containing protein [Pseudomonas soli]|uniref:Toll-Interleukin receptor n=1 Tax=Pseudomonas soli TaxID=1306993 RepID=A0A2V4I3N5_9PSED|nr:TIR domain-containing protein [Pseudomonas soli]PYB84159.1 toll-Interleukin receptor [Pseudomonas soli]
MKVFISWSGNRSRAVAEVLSDWIKCVLQASEPWISTRHIDRGSLWFSEINEKLRDISVGIVCLTQDNKDKPWILFESGALAKGLSGNRVCTFLVDLQPHDLTDPLAQFNHTKPDKESVWELMRTLNACLAERSLDERVLEKAFVVYWPQFEEEFAMALANNEPDKVTKPRSQQDVLSEILGATRELTKRISKIEANQRVVTNQRYNAADAVQRWITSSDGDAMNRAFHKTLSPSELAEYANKVASEVFSSGADRVKDEGM